jgi:hypothetical protein
MVRKSKKNSQPHLKTRLRKEYKDAHRSGCELWALLDESGWEKWLRTKDESQRHNLQLHHILHSHRQLYDDKSNFILLSACAHVPFVHTFPIEGTIACWNVKYRKCDVDVAAIHKMTNVNIVSWLDLARTEVPFFENLRVETLRGLSEQFPDFVWGT